MPDLRAPYIEARDRLLALTDGLSHEDFNRKPGPKSWSAGECVMHLNTVAEGYLPVLEDAAARDEPRGAPPCRYGWLGRRFIAAVTPGSRAMPTAGSMKPPPSHPQHSEIDMDHALERFREDTDRFVAAIDEAEGLDLGAIKRPSPFLPVMKLPLGVYLDALGQHALRHVAQAERAVAAAQA